MKTREFEKLFLNNNQKNAFVKLNKNMDKHLNFFCSVLFEEIFDRTPLSQYNKSDININLMQKQFIDCKNTFLDKELVYGCRKFKGLFEDCISFICQNHNLEAIPINSNNAPKQFRNYVTDNSRIIFTDLFDDLKENNYLTQIYNFIAKIDHHTSIKNYHHNIESSKKVNKVSYSYINILIFNLLLISDQIYKSNAINNFDYDFILHTSIILFLLLNISFLRNFNEEEYLHIYNISKLDNPTDMKYFSDLKDFNTKVLNKTDFSFSDEEKQELINYLKEYEEKLMSKGYSNIINF